MSYKVCDVSNYIINYAIDRQKPVSPLKLQKLLFYIQAAFLAERQSPAFDEDIEAWKYGPVIEREYHRLKIFAGREITDKLDENSRDMRLLLMNEDNEPYQNPAKVIWDSDKKRIEKVVDSYANYSAMAMVSKTHKEEPWIEADEEKQSVIDQEQIKEYYNKNRHLIYGVSKDS